LRLSSSLSTSYGALSPSLLLLSLSLSLSLCFPPLRLFQSSIEDLLAQVAAAQAKDPGGFSSDALTRAILERLNEEVAKVYSEAAAGAPDAEGADGHASGLHDDDDVGAADMDREGIDA
jgi:hypothetical protein